MLVLVAVVAVADCAEPGSGSVITASLRWQDDLRPLIVGRFNAGGRLGLESAFRVAAERLHSRGTCRALFSELGTDGLARLRDTRYQAAAEVGAERVCRRGTGVAAFTAVGSPRTIVCPGFDSLTVKQAAVIILHEALHFAGLPEGPPTPGAMSSTEINDMIADRCGL
jgi:hypothetical protein